MGGSSRPKESPTYDVSQEGPMRAASDAAEGRPSNTEGGAVAGAGAAWPTAGSRPTELSLESLAARDQAPREIRAPKEVSHGKSSAKSLLNPQELARRVLPARLYEKLQSFAREGVPAECGEPWPKEVIEKALEAGPHVSALTPKGVELLWEDVQYQADAGFVRIIAEGELFRKGTPKELKISRVAVVPQTNRRDRIILNLSAQVTFQKTRKRKASHHPSVNETTKPAEDQEAVQKLGSATLALMMFMFETRSDWEIQWQKIDLSDGFWRMIIEAGKEANFVFQMPPRKGDRERYFVVPSALQMGWTNSPAYFCTATDITRTLFKRVLALTVDNGIREGHRYEMKCVDRPDPNLLQELLADATVASQVFVDDFMNGIAGKPDRPEKSGQQLWVTRGAMHSIHGVFPPPEVVRHEGGKDSISTKKVNKGDAKFETEKELLGNLYNGSPGWNRRVGLPKDKRDRYASAVDEALNTPAHRIGLRGFQRVLGKLQYASNVMPAMRGHFTPLNSAMRGKSEKDFVGLGIKSEAREALEDIRGLLDLTVDDPSHICELVPEYLPHYYGTVDASGVGFGGVTLPCTKWIRPLVWRLEMPPDLHAAVQEGTLTMVDCEFAGYFIANCMLHDELEAMGQALAGMNSHFLSDNSPTVGIVNRQASRAKSSMPSRTLRWMARRQRHYRTGPQTIEHWPGEQNTMADFPSRSYEQGFSADEDERFLQEFTNRYPLPLQLKSWRLVRPRTEICSAAFLLLRKIKESTHRPTGRNGDSGAALPPALANTLTSQTYKPSISTWNEATCVWPLLLPCGRECSLATSPLLGRRLRERFEYVDRCWQTEDLQILGKEIRAAATSTPGSADS